MTGTRQKGSQQLAAGGNTATAGKPAITRLAAAQQVSSFYRTNRKRSSLLLRLSCAGRCLRHLPQLCLPATPNTSRRDGCRPTVGTYLNNQKVQLRGQVAMLAVARSLTQEVSLRLAKEARMAEAPHTEV